MRPMGEGRWLFGRGYPKPYFEVDANNFKETCDNDFVVDVYDRWCKRIPALEGSRLLHGYAALYDVNSGLDPLHGDRDPVSKGMPTPAAEVAMPSRPGQSLPVNWSTG